MHWILKLILHLFFWSTYCLFAGLVSFKLSEGFNFIQQHLLIFSINALWAAVVFYLHYLLLYKVIFERKFLQYLGLSISSSLLVSFLFFILFQVYYSHKGATIELVQFVPSAIGTFIIGNCGSLLRGFIGWINDAGRKAELERQNLSVELEMLRSQLNHHFLFNTLNNIDALIFKNPQKASDALISLSSILRYMLYETSPEKVPLTNELANIKNIIELEQLRMSTPGYAKITMHGNVEGVMIPPLLFVSFVENAYKHSNYRGKLPVIDIRFQINDATLVFTCVNFYEKIKDSEIIRGKLGLVNIRRRLELLYGKTCKFEAAESENVFKVKLEIPVDSWK